MGAFLRPYGTGTGSDVTVPVVKAGSSDFATSSDWTPAAGDVKVSKDGGAAANIATLPTYIANVGWKFVFSDAELQCARLNVNVVDSATKAIEDQHLVVETYGNASAQHVALPANVTQWSGTAVATPDTAGHPKVTIKSGTGTGEIATTGGKVDEVSALTGHTAQTGDSFARLGAPVGSSISFDLQAVDAVVDFNAAILPNVLSDTNELVDNRLTAARAAVLSDLIDGGRLDLLIDGIKAVTDALPDSGALSSLATASALATVDTVVDGIQTDLDNGTDGLGAIKTAVDAMPTASANAAALLAATVDGIAVSTILARTNARVRGKFTLVDDTLTFFLEDGSTESFALDLTAAGGDPA